MTTGDIGSIGLLLDIIGAFFLAESFIIKRLEEAVREGSDYMDGNPFRLRSAIQQRIEARVGFAFLGSGFFCQLLSYANILPSGTSDKLPYIVPFVVLIFVVSLLLVRKASVNSSRQVVAGQWARIRKQLEDDPKLAVFFAPALDVKFKKNEEPEVIAKRTLKCLSEYDREP